MLMLSLILLILPMQQVFNDGNVNYCPPCNCICTLTTRGCPPCDPCPACPGLVFNYLLNQEMLALATMHCMSGPNVTASTKCKVLDVNGDGYVDLKDVSQQIR